MEFGGAEKKIQTLFSELALEDQKHAPRFEQLLTRVEKTTPAPGFRRSFAMTAAAIIIAAISFAAWSARSESALNIAPLDLPTLASLPLNQFASIVESPRPQRNHKRARPRQSENVSLKAAAMLSRWQSPTQDFMQSPSSVSLNSLPQLNQSAKDLESFLPKKESNQ